MPSFLSKVFGRKKAHDEKDRRSSSGSGSPSPLGGKFEDVRISPTASNFRNGHGSGTSRSSSSNSGRGAHAVNLSPSPRRTSLDPPPHLSLNLSSFKDDRHRALGLVFERDASFQTVLPDSVINERRLSPQETEQLVKACSQAIIARGLDTLGLMHPHWHAASTDVQRKLISLFLNSLSSPSPTQSITTTTFAHTHPLSEFDSELGFTRTPQDVAAVLRWGLRHLELDSSQFGKEADWYHDFYLAERSSTYPPKAFSTIIPPLLPNSHYQLLITLFDLVNYIAAHSETNGISGSKFSKFVGLWLLYGQVRVPNEDWKAFYERWERAGRQLEHLFLAQIRNENNDRPVPKRLTGLILKYPYDDTPSSASDGEELLPRPRFSTRQFDALLLRIETTLPGFKNNAKSQHPFAIVAEALTSTIPSSNGGEFEVWKVVQDTPGEGEYRILEDESIRILSLVPHPERPLSPTFTGLSSAISLTSSTTPWTPIASPQRRSASTTESLVTPISPATTNNGPHVRSPTSPIEPQHSLGWSEFQHTGFTESITLSTQLAATLMDKDVEVTEPPVIPVKRSMSRRSTSSTVKNRKSTDVGASAVPSRKPSTSKHVPAPAVAKAPSTPPEERSTASTKLLGLTYVQIDEAFIDFWHDSFMDPIATSWPNFVLVKLKHSVVSQLQAKVSDGKKVEWVVIEQSFAKPPPPPIPAPLIIPTAPSPAAQSAASPASPTTASASATRSARPQPDSATSPRKRFSFFSRTSSDRGSKRKSHISPSSSATFGGKATSPKTPKVGELGEILQEEPEREQADAQGQDQPQTQTVPPSPPSTESSARTATVEEAKESGSGAVISAAAETDAAAMSHTAAMETAGTASNGAEGIKETEEVDMRAPTLPTQNDHDQERAEDSTTSPIKHDNVTAQTSSQEEAAKHEEQNKDASRSAPFETASDLLDKEDKVGDKRLASTPSSSAPFDLAQQLEKEEVKVAQPAPRAQSSPSPEPVVHVQEESDQQKHEVATRISRSPSPATAPLSPDSSAQVKEKEDQESTRAVISQEPPKHVTDTQDNNEKVEEGEMGTNEAVKVAAAALGIAAAAAAAGVPVAVASEGEEEAETETEIPAQSVTQVSPPIEPTRSEEVEEQIDGAEVVVSEEPVVETNAIAPEIVEPQVPAAEERGDIEPVAAASLAVEETVHKEQEAPLTQEDTSPGLAVEVKHAEPPVEAVAEQDAPELEEPKVFEPEVVSNLAVVESATLDEPVRVNDDVLKSDEASPESEEPKSSIAPQVPLVTEEPPEAVEHDNKVDVVDQSQIGAADLATDPTAEALIESSQDQSTNAAASPTKSLTPLGPNSPESQEHPQGDAFPSEHEEETEPALSFAYRSAGEPVAPAAVVAPVGDLEPEQGSLHDAQDMNKIPDVEQLQKAAESADLISETPLTKGSDSPPGETTEQSLLEEPISSVNNATSGSDSPIVQQVNLVEAPDSVPETAPLVIANNVPGFEEIGEPIVEPKSETRIEADTDKDLPTSALVIEPSPAVGDVSHGDQAELLGKNENGSAVLDPELTAVIERGTADSTYASPSNELTSTTTHEDSINMTASPIPYPESPLIASDRHDETSVDEQQSNGGNADSAVASRPTTPLPQTSPITDESLVASSTIVSDATPSTAEELLHGDETSGEQGAEATTDPSSSEVEGKQTQLSISEQSLGESPPTVTTEPISGSEIGDSNETSIMGAEANSPAHGSDPLHDSSAISQTTEATSPLNGTSEAVTSTPGDNDPVVKAEPHLDENVISMADVINSTIEPPETQAEPPSLETTPQSIESVSASETQSTPIDTPSSLGMEESANTEHVAPREEQQMVAPTNVIPPTEPLSQSSVPEVGYEQHASTFSVEQEPSPLTGQADTLVKLTDVEVAKPSDNVSHVTEAQGTTDEAEAAGAKGLLADTSKTATSVPHADEDRTTTSTAQIKGDECAQESDLDAVDADIEERRDSSSSKQAPIVPLEPRAPMAETAVAPLVFNEPPVDDVRPVTKDAVQESPIDATPLADNITFTDATPTSINRTPASEQPT